MIFPLETEYIPAWNCFCFKKCTSSVGAGINPVTGVGSICVSHRVVWICLLSQVSRVVFFPFFLYPKYKGIIIPTYFCVSCSPDIPRLVMEIKHGPQGQGKVVHCSVTITSYLTLCFVTLIYFFNLPWYILYIHKTNIFTKFSYCKHRKVSVK